MNIEIKQKIFFTGEDFNNVPVVNKISGKYYVLLQQMSLTTILWMWVILLREEIPILQADLT